MKKHIKILIILLVLTIGLVSINQINNVKADSGWDTSYDSGGSSSSDSSWNSGSSYDSGSSWSSSRSSSRSSSSSSSDSKSSFFAFLSMIVIYAILFIICIIKLYINLSIARRKEEKIELKRRKEEKIKREELQQRLNKYIDKTLDELEAEFVEKFVKIQNAWMDFDYDTLKKLCSNEIYNTYYEELEALNLKKEQNIMSDFAKFKDDIINFSIENNILTIEYKLTIAFYDYVINTETDEIVKGNNRIPVHNVYILKFSKKLDQSIDTCPNCGGKIKPGTTTCEHCKAVIIQDSNTFVLSEKRRVN